MSQQSSRQTSFMPRQAWLIAVNMGLLLIVIGTAMPLFHLMGLVPRSIFTAGAALVLIGRLFAPTVKDQSLRVRRLCRLEVWVGIIFCAGAFFMWYTPDRMDWLAFTLAGAAVQIYVSMAIPRAMSAPSDGADGSKRAKK